MMMPFDTALMTTRKRDELVPTDDERIAWALRKEMAKTRRREVWAGVLRRSRAVEGRMRAFLALF